MANYSRVVRSSAATAAGTKPTSSGYQRRDSRCANRASRVASLNRDELADGILSRAALETKNKSKAECLRQAPEGIDVRAVLAALDSRNRGVARAHAFSQLLLGQAKLHPVLDNDSRDLLEWSKARLLRSVRGASGATSPRVDDRCSDRGFPLRHARSLPDLIRNRVTAHRDRPPADDAAAVRPSEL